MSASKKRREKNQACSDFANHYFHVPWCMEICVFFSDKEILIGQHAKIYSDENQAIMVGKLVLHGP